MEGQIEGIVVDEYGLNFRGTTIAPGVPMAKFVASIILLVIGLSLFVQAMTIDARTEPAKQMAEAKAAAERQLAELAKRRRIQPTVLVLIAGALIFIIGGFVLFILSHSYPGPPFGW